MATRKAKKSTKRARVAPPKSRAAKKASARKPAAKKAPPKPKPPQSRAEAAKSSVRRARGPKTARGGSVAASAALARKAKREEKQRKAAEAEAKRLRKEKAEAKRRAVAAENAAARAQAAAKAAPKPSKVKAVAAAQAARLTEAGRTIARISGRPPTARVTTGRAGKKKARRRVAGSPTKAAMQATAFNSPGGTSLTKAEVRAVNARARVASPKGKGKAADSKGSLKDPFAKLHGNRSVTARDIEKAARTAGLQVWKCAGPVRRGCGGGGAKVISAGRRRK